jgi:hypothetical protein
VKEVINGKTKDWKGYKYVKSNMSLVEHLKTPCFSLDLWIK